MSEIQGTEIRTRTAQIDGPVLTNDLPEGMSQRRAASAARRVSRYLCNGLHESLERLLFAVNHLLRRTTYRCSLPIMVTTRVDQIRCNRRSSRMQTSGQVERNFAARTQ